MDTFDVEIFNPDPPRMVPDTARIVSALQNTTLHPLDLLVRESIQNSLDAAVDEDPDRDVGVSFARGDFDGKAFADFLGPDCSSRLLKKIPGLNVGNHYIAIRDRNCCGLTGDARDNTSNLYKLVYGFLDGKGVENASAGGSFGVGKTVFLHFGIGFVCYYSRTQEGHRLALFYCRNNTKKLIFEKAFMPYQLAWWGRRVDLGAKAVSPIQGIDSITQFLAVFNIKPYSERETGTTVIIPFFDEQVAHNEQHQFAPWLNSVDDYLRFSVLKWYGPRFRGDFKKRARDEESEDFRSYEWGRYLHCTFPDKKQLSLIETDSVSVPERKIFTLIRDLYDVARGRIPCPGQVYRISVYQNDAPAKNVCFGSEQVGWLAITKINYKVGEYQDTYSVLSALAPEDTVDDRKGFVLFCRKPGMIMTYDDSWSKVLSSVTCQPGEFFIGIFVVNSENYVYTDKRHYEIVCPLDQLFRETEKSDHYGWPTDATSHGIKLINRIVTQLRSEVAKRFTIAEDTGDKKARGDIARGLGAMFMLGRTGFGGVPLFPEGNGGIEPQKPPPGPARSKGRVKKTKIEFGEPSFQQNGSYVDVTVPVVVCAAEKDSLVCLGVGIETDGAPLTAATWQSEDGVFPIVARSMTSSIKGGGPLLTVDSMKAEFNIDMSSACNTPVEFKLTYTVRRTDMATVLLRKES